MSDDLQARLDGLMDEYLAIGCPCRFPRFRAVVSRQTRGAGGGSFTSEDQRGLIRSFERKVPIVEKRPLEEIKEVSEGMWLGRCGVCGSEVRRSYDEYSPGGYIDMLRIRPAPGLVDLGAPIEGRVYRCRPFQSPGPPMTGLAQAARVFPFIDEDEWFTWMRERAPNPKAP